MDLRFPDTPASEAEHAALDAALGGSTHRSSPQVWDAATGGVRRAAGLRHLLLPGLHALQDRMGFISEGGLTELCKRLDVPPAEAYGVASFYHMLTLESAPARCAYVCEDIACARTSSPVDVQALGSDVRVVHAPCLGLCEQAPAALVVESGTEPSHHVLSTPTSTGPVPQQGEASLVLLRRVGVVNPASLDDYVAAGGYTALARAIEMGAHGVIEAVTQSGLVGRGGAAFPTGRKWAAVASQEQTTRYVVANADESEPGTFKDRVLMEGDPFALVESMTIAGFAVGARRGYIYLRDEYRDALGILEHAIAAAHTGGYLGDSVLHSGVGFDIEIVRGAGAYICGEETAIFNSIEGFRGEPRSKPPYPTEVGLFGKPTLVNNVETLVNVLPILTSGPEAFAAVGAGSSRGTKLFCLSGAVATPGVYEVPFGITLRSLIERAGGVTGSGTMQCVLLGGAAGSFVTPEHLDTELTLEGTRSIGATLGSGVVHVIDTATPLGPLLTRIADFFRHESCGQCVPCRVGTVRQHEIVTRLTLGARRKGDLELLRDVGVAMRDASICGLGQTAWNAIESAIDGLGVFS